MLLTSGDTQNLPYLVQTIGLIATVLGVALGTASLVWAYKAAQRAMGAREAAEEASRAATRAGRIAQLSDLIADMQELQTMLARVDFLAIAGKANLLRGRIVRFKGEGYNELSDEQKENLDLVRAQLEGIAEVALKSRPMDETKAARIHIGYGIANEALNKVLAIHAQHAAGE
ncbi:MAG: hypothetical protein A2V70_01800 [Planctomycetes bacterium RBG_13_63_9]|nr:MAG: hypothetical protein A2V70_01800 [Planctomycetes bacterium RBG_13_63_9]